MPLAEVLVKIHRYRAPGTRRLQTRRRDQADLPRSRPDRFRHDQPARRIARRQAPPRRAASPGEQYEESVCARTRDRQTAWRDARGDESALAAKISSSPLHEQIEEIIWPVFGWDSGTVSFTRRPRQTAGVHQGRHPCPDGDSAAASAALPTRARSSRASARRRRCFSRADRPCRGIGAR